jgi:hypothetical protein
MNFDAPGSEIEDEIEVDPSLPGKYVFANVGVSDGVPDWADGFDIDPSKTADDSLSGSDKILTPFALTIMGIQNY